jgi:cytochrome d ubiquinol oxidase subunit I
MVGIGTALMLLALWLAYLVYKKREIPTGNWFLKAVSVSGIGAILALWSGWIVTEVGRQPWIVNGYMKTSEAVTDANGIWGAFIFTLLLYAAIGTIAVLVLRRMSRRWREGGEGTAEEEPAPYSPIGHEGEVSA